MNEAQRLDSPQLEPVVGSSPDARRQRRAIKKLSRLDENFLIIGETGVGKEFTARHVHNSSGRSGKAFVKINCRSLGDSIDFKTLFGEESEGDQAVTRSLGLIEKANNGILYLDHIGDMDTEYQEAFLRLLQDGEFRKVGGKESIPVDLRIAATNEYDLVPMIDKGEFRRDLYNLLAELAMYIPPLREKKQDIPEIFNHYLNRYAPDTGEEPAVESEIFESILEYKWKGNVRELVNAVNNLVTLSPEGTLSAEFLPFRIKKHPYDFMDPTQMKKIVGDVEVFLIRKALCKFGGNQVKAAKLLGIPEATLRFKMKKYAIPKD